MDAPDRSPDPELRCELSERARRVQDAIDAMPPAEREVFVLCDVEGSTDEEAAWVLGVPVGTAKSRLRRARAHFAASAAALDVPTRPRTASEAP